MDDLAELLERLGQRLPDLTEGDADLHSGLPVDLGEVTRRLSVAEREMAPGHRRAATLRARLGFVVGTRYITEGERRDRDEAIRLLRAARQAGAPGGLGEADLVRGTMMLALLLLPLPVPWPAGEMPGFEALIQWSVRQPMSGPEVEAELAEAERLLTELRSLRVGRQWLEQTARLAGVARQLRSMLGGDLGGLVALTERIFAAEPNAPYQDQIRGLLRLAQGMAPGASPFPPVGAPPSPDPERDAAELVLQADLAAPGTVGADRLREIIELLETAEGDSVGVGTWGKMSLALRTGDSELALETAEEVRRMAHDVPGLESLLPALPMVLRLIRGNLQDEDAALRALVETFPERPDQQPAPQGTLEAEVARLGGAMKLMMRLHRLDRSNVTNEQDRARYVAALQEIHGELLELARGGGTDDPWHGVVRLGLVLVECELALSHGGIADIRTALERLERFGIPDATPPFVRSWLTIAARTLASATDLLDHRDPGGVAGLSERLSQPLEGEEMLVNARAFARSGVAKLLLAAHERSGERALLDEAIAELERARDDLTEGAHVRALVDVRWGLASAYAARAEPGDARRATAAGLASLHHVAGDVTMQLGAEHALETARAGADRGLRIAGWALRDGLLPEAVRALEAGRALVLRAAAASDGVPERLESLGRGDLAAEWRRAAPPSEGGADVPADPDAIERLVPSTLRRRALDALGEGVRDLLAVPEVPELVAGLAAGDADALVYLLPGAALVVRREAGREEALRLPGLDDASDGPVGAYLSAAAGANDPAEQSRWEAALEELCDWAGREVVGPVLRRIPAGAAAGPPRVVLVPCGNLGVVPWHAARLPEGGHALERAVFSYASSGAQFLAAVGRERTRPTERPVLVADPTLRLLWAVDEVTTLHRACYADALLYGDVADEPVPVGGAGTPEELLDAFDGGGASLLHVASHGSAGGRPTVSALDLTRPLTVARILDRPAGGPGAGQRGPLVVLSACETDLSTRDHDEALTLTTAFLARGAADAVGSRWVTRDSASALLMAVFHHGLTAGGLAPPDALRAAQLWMLDPARTPPPGVTGHLLDEAARRPLARVRCWAPFIHQGNPSPRWGAGE
ncbi:CHAT domain-containing protein [Streptomyces sp. B6B3]|uniref:CHAT domain-containing protein n=1 Tax=Streptomyces sp. B6B3 TaxID=3153570 RepID=UPI00325DDAF3